jgi:hypothetical protein
MTHEQAIFSKGPAITAADFARAELLPRAPHRGRRVLRVGRPVPAASPVVRCASLICGLPQQGGRAAVLELMEFPFRGHVCRETASWVIRLLLAVGAMAAIAPKGC